MFGNNKLNYEEIKTENTNIINPFVESLRVEFDSDKEKLLKIKHNLELNGINEENIIMLTKDLNDVQKKKLEDMYKEDNIRLELSIQRYKNKFINIRKKLAKC